MEVTYLSTSDVVVLVVTLLIPPLIGIYFAYHDRGRISTLNYYFGDRKLNPIAVGISSAVTVTSAITLIAYPVETYKIGTVFCWVALPALLATLVVVTHFIPMYCRLRTKTIYEYMELRFNAKVRRVCALMICCNDIFYMGVVTFIPSLALNAITPIPLTWGIAITSCVCTFYTSLGGIKAVLWSDVVQAGIMLTGIIVLGICVLVNVGGFGNVLSALERGKRLTFFSSRKFDITSRMDPVAIAFGECFIYLYSLGFTQTVFQRIQSCRNVTQARLSTFAYTVLTTLFVYISIANGFLLYTYFEGCDPVQSGRVKHMEQAIPYVALQTFHKIPGMTGLFIAAISSGSLSTISSGLNANSGVILEDFLLPNFPDMSQKTRLICGKITGAILGMVVMSIAYIISSLSSNVFKATRSFMGTASGPVMGLYILGMYFPWTNPLGAAVGGCFGYAFMLWIFIGSNFLLTVPSRVVLPPVTTDQCPEILNMTSAYNLTTVYDEMTLPYTQPPVTQPEMSYSFDQMLYSLNFHYYLFVGVSVTVTIGLITSFITGASRPSEANPQLFIPILDNALLPHVVRKFFRFGVPERLKATEGTEVKIGEGQM